MAESGRPGRRDSRPRAVRRNAENDDPPQDVGSLVRGLLSAGPMRRGLALGRLGRQWDEVVGERLARETAPGSLEGGVLTVEVTTAAWAAQVRFLGEEIRRRANQVLGAEDVAGVRVSVGRTARKPLRPNG